MESDASRLEAALAASWDRETLAVYADHLVERGDPRGELIAIDLRLEQRSTPELVARRASLLTAWLGPLVPSDPHTPWIGDSFRLGFVEDLVILVDEPDGAARLRAMLESPLAPYLRRVTIRGARHRLQDAITTLARYHHAWLGALALESTRGGEKLVFADALIPVTPRLVELELGGDLAIAELPHPGLRRLVLGHAWAMAAIYEPEEPLATIESLTLAFRSSPYEPWPTLPQLALPGLRALDLAPNDAAPAAGDDAYDEDEYDDAGEAEAEAPPMSAFEYLATRDARVLLERVRLPALRSHTDFEHLQAAVVGMPRLETIEIARGSHFRAPELAHTRARFVRPPPWPWPPPAQLSDSEQLAVLVPGSRSADIVALGDAVAVMERRFEALPADVRYAWTRFWGVVDALGRAAWRSDARRAWTDPMPFPAQLLVDALEACDIGGSRGWRELRDQLRFRRPFPPDAMVALHRERER